MNAVESIVEVRCLLDELRVTSEFAEVRLVALIPN